MVLRLYPPLIGGPATVAYQLSKLLAERGVDVFVVTQHAEGLPYHEVIDEVNIFRVPFLAPPGMSTYSTPRMLSGVLSLITKTLEVTRKHDIRIVDVLDVTTAGLAGLVLSSLSNRKFLLKFGGDLVFEYLSLKGIRACDETWNVEESWKVDDLRAKLLYWIETQYVRSYDLLLPDSYYGAELLRKLGAEDKKIRVVLNGVDTKLFSPRESDLDMERRLDIRKPVILVAGRLVPWKGFRYLVNTAPTILDSFPDATFLVVGDGPERGNLEIQVDDLGLNRNFVFTGRIPHQEMVKTISCADVFVLPSLFDTTPNVLLEVMSSEKPTVASNIEGIREVIKNNDTGILVPPANDALLGEAIMSLLCDPKKSSNIARRARRFIQENYDWSKIIDKRLSIYKSQIE
jgi:glycosyltransferase involved in cell wall biosynthesis